MRILVTGADGQLGQELQLQGRISELELIPTDVSELDITDANAVGGAFARFKPSLVINAAAYTQVDRAESEPLPAHRINAEGPANLAAACRSARIGLIHISTDYVFDGAKRTPYTESDPVAPIGVYGRSKASGEDRVRALLPDHIILRTSWLYGVFGHNFVKTMLRLGREEPVVKVVDDQFGSPTSAADLARAILEIAQIIRKNSAVPWGTYHYCGKGIATWYEFAEKIFSLAVSYHFIERPVIQAISTEQYPTPAKRPRFSALDCRRIQHKFGIANLPWPDSLAAVIKRIIHGNKS